MNTHSVFGPEHSWSKEFLKNSCNNRKLVLFWELLYNYDFTTPLRKSSNTLRVFRGIPMHFWLANAWQMTDVIYANCWKKKMVVRLGFRRAGPWIVQSKTLSWYAKERKGGTTPSRRLGGMFRLWWEKVFYRPQHPSNNLDRSAGQVRYSWRFPLYRSTLYAVDPCFVIKVNFQYTEYSPCERKLISLLSELILHLLVTNYSECIDERLRSDKGSKSLPAFFELHCFD